MTVLKWKIVTLKTWIIWLISLSKVEIHSLIKKGLKAQVRLIEGIKFNEVVIEFSDERLGMTYNLSNTHNYCTLP